MALNSAIDASAVARVVGVQTTPKNFRNGNVLLLPQRLMLVGQGSSASTFPTTKAQVTSAFEVGTNYGFGSPLHLAALEIFPINGDGVRSVPVTVYPLEDDGSGVAAQFEVTPTGVATAQGVYYVNVNGARSNAIVAQVGATVAQFVTQAAAATAAILDLPVTAADGVTTLDLTAKWKGASGNGIDVQIEGPTDAGFTFAVASPVAGAVNPSINTALAQVGNVWETMVLNCLDIADTATLDLYQAFGVGRWLPTVRKPLVVFTGNTIKAVASAVAISDARATDYTNSQLVAPGSRSLPFAVAARQLARIIVLANNNPPHDYGRQSADGILPGDDGDQWVYQERDLAVKAGSSTIEVRDGVVDISDVVTFYHPAGNPIPEYRYVVDIVKLQNIIYNISLIFNTAEWDGAPLLPDSDPTTNASAKKPKMARADVAAMLDSLGLQAIISDPKTAKANTRAEIDSMNPKRLNVQIPVQLVGNSNIISVGLDFGFFFGTDAIVA